jgi:hypothetical protein
MTACHGQGVGSEVPVATQPARDFGSQAALAQPIVPQSSIHVAPILSLSLIDDDIQVQWQMTSLCRFRPFTAALIPFRRCSTAGDVSRLRPPEEAWIC